MHETVLDIERMDDDLEILDYMYPNAANDDWYEVEKAADSWLKE